MVSWAYIIIAVVPHVVGLKLSLLCVFRRRKVFLRFAVGLNI